MPFMLFQAITDQGIMKSNILSSKSQRILALVMSVFLLCGFTTWLCIYSYDYPIGIPTMTIQSDPAWSPDGRFVAFKCYYSYPFDEYDLTFSESMDIGQEWTGDICLVDIGTWELKRITYGRGELHPVWSTDGDVLIWKRSMGGLMEYNLQTGAITESSNFADYTKGVSEQSLEFSEQTLLSPNQQSLLRLTQVRGGYDFVVLGKNKEIYDSNFLIYPDPVWSPDNTVLVVRRNRDDDKQEVTFINLLTKEEFSLQFDQQFDHLIYFMSWSPDGKKVAFQTRENAFLLELASPPKEILEIVSFEIEENTLSYSIIEQKSYILHGMVSSNIIWSPSGKYIAYSSAEAKEKLSDGGWLVNPDEIWLLDLETDKQFTLVDKTFNLWR